MMQAFEYDEALGTCSVTDDAGDRVTFTVAGPFVTVSIGEDAAVNVPADVFELVALRMRRPRR